MQWKEWIATGTIPDAEREKVNEEVDQRAKEKIRELWGPDPVEISPFSVLLETILLLELLLRKARGERRTRSWKSEELEGAEDEELDCAEDKE